MEDLQQKIIELMDLFDEGEVTTADKIDRPERALEKQAIDDFMKRNPMAGGGMLVQPSADGSRPGYAKDTRTSFDKFKSAEEKYTGSAKPPKKKKWQGVFGKEKADEIYNDYVKFYTDAYNNKNMSQVGEAEEYFKKVYGDDGRKASDLLKRNGYTNLKEAPYKLKQKLLIELVDDAQSKLKFTNKFDIIDKVFTESAAKQARANGLSSFLGKTDGRLRLSWFGQDLFNKVDGMDKIEDKISKALDYMVENNIEIKDVKKATGSVFTQGTSPGDKSRVSPIKKTIVSLVDNGKDGISRALLNKGIQKNAWYQSQTQNGKNLFDYVSREYGTEFIGEGFLDAYESGKSRFGRVTVKGSTQMPLPESLIFQFAARSADRNFKAGTYEDGPVKITDLKGNELDFGSLPVNERGQRIIDPSKHKFTYNGTLYGKNNLRKLGYQSGDFTEVYQIAQDFKSYNDELVPNPKNPKGKKIPFRKLMDMAGIDYFMAIGHDDSKGGVRTRPFNNFQIQNKFVNKSLDSAYRQVKNKDLRKRIANDIYGDLKGLRGQAYKDAWIKNNTKLLNDIILNRNIPPSLYRQAGENIIKSDVFQTFSKKKQDEVIRVSGLNKTQVANLLNAFCGSGRVKQASGTNPDGLTCSMEEIQRGIQKETDKARKVSKDGRIPKKFGKLRALGSALFGVADPAIEFMFAAPFLVAGDIEGAKRQTIFGGYGFPDRDISNMSNKEAQRFLKHEKATKDWMNNYFIAEEKKQELKGLKPNTGAFELATNQLNRANENMANIADDYGTFGYSFVGKDTPLQGKINLQKQIRGEVAQDFEKKIEKAGSTQFFKDSDPNMLDLNLRQLGGDPKQVTPITDLESYMANKGEPMAGNENFFFNVKPYVLRRAIEYGQPELFDDYAAGAGVEAPGRKSLQDAYSEIPLEYASQLAALEKKQLEEGLLKKELGLGTGFAKGGRAGFKLGSVRKGLLKLIDDSVKSTPKDTTSALDKLIKKTLDEDLFDKKDRIIDSINISEAKKRKNLPYNMRVSEEPKNLDFYDAIIKSNFRTKTGPYFDRIRRARENKAGGGLLKQAGDRSGPPPESGPNPQGLQGLLNRVKKG